MEGIKGKFIVCSSEKVLKDYTIIYEKDKIIDLLPSEEAKNKYKNINIVDRSNHIITPGFINGHMHQYGVLSRGIPVEVSFKDFEEFLKLYWWPFVEDRIDGDLVKITTKASAIEMIESGIVAYIDTLEAPFVEENTLIEQGKIINEIGLKAILSLESSERVSKENGLWCLDENQRLIEWSKKTSGNVKGAICTHTTFTCSKEFIKTASELAKKNNALLQFHLSESKYEVEQNKERPLFTYLEQGALNENVLASQCVKVNMDEIDILKNKNIKVVHMPLSNCEVGGGFAPVVDMINRGIPVALGTDGYVNDFFEVMRGCFLIHKASLEDASVLPAHLVFKMATEHGALVMGLENSGKISIGKKVDLISIEDKFKTPITLKNIYDQIVVHGRKEFINDVLIDGNYIYENRNFKTLNPREVLLEMKNKCGKFWGEGETYV